MAHLPIGVRVEERIPITQENVGDRTFGFNIEWPVGEDSTLRVQQITASGEQNPAPLDTGRYSIVRDSGGGTIRLTDPADTTEPVRLADGDTLRIYRDTPVALVTDFPARGYATSASAGLLASYLVRVLEELAGRTETHATIIVGRTQVKPYVLLGQRGIQLGDLEHVFSEEVAKAVQVDGIDFDGTTLEFSTATGQIHRVDLSSLAGTHGQPLLTTSDVDARIRRVTDPLSQRLDTAEEFEFNLRGAGTLATDVQVNANQTNTAYPITGALPAPAPERGRKIGVVLKRGGDADIETSFDLATLRERGRVDPTMPAIGTANAIRIPLAGSGNFAYIGIDADDAWYFGTNSTGSFEVSLEDNDLDIEDFARKSSMARLPDAKLPETPPAGWGGGATDLPTAADDGRFPTWNVASGSWEAGRFLDANGFAWTFDAAANTWSVNLADASESVAGKVRLATASEARAATSGAVALSPLRAESFLDEQIPPSRRVPSFQSADNDKVLGVTGGALAFVDQTGGGGGTGNAATWAERGNTDIAPVNKLPNDGYAIDEADSFAAPGQATTGGADYGGVTGAGTVTFDFSGTTFTVRRALLTNGAFDLWLSIGNRGLTTAERSTLAGARLRLVDGTVLDLAEGFHVSGDQTDPRSIYRWRGVPSAAFIVGANTIGVYDDPTAENFVPEVPSGATAETFLGQTSGSRAWQSLPVAAEDGAGIVELADAGEAQAGTDDKKALSPLRLRGELDRAFPTSQRVPAGSATDQGRPLVSGGAGQPPSFQQLDAEDIVVDASGFDGQLGTTDTNVQRVAQKLDDLQTGAIEEGNSLPTAPRIGQRFILLADENVARDRTLTNDEPNTGPTFTRWLIPGATANGPQYIESYAAEYGDNARATDTARRNKTFLVGGGTYDPADDAQVVFYAPGQSRTGHTYQVANDPLAGLPHWHEITGLDFAAAGSTVDLSPFFNVLSATDGDLYPSATVPAGDKSFAGGDHGVDGWVDTPGVAAPWATQGQPEPRTLLAVTEVADGPGTGLTINSPSSVLFGPSHEFAPAFDLDDDDKQIGTLQVEAVLTETTEQATNLGFSASATPPKQIRLNGWTFVSSVRDEAVYQRGAANGVVVLSATVYRGGTAMGVLNLVLTRISATNRLAYQWHWVPGAGATGSAITISLTDLEVEFLHSDGPSDAGIQGISVREAGTLEGTEGTVNSLDFRSASFDVSRTGNEVDIDLHGAHMNRAGVVQLSTDSEATGGSDNTTAMTPLRTRAAIDARVPAASMATAGKAEIATQVETQTGSDNGRIVSPLRLREELDRLFPANRRLPALGLAGQVPKVNAGRTGIEWAQDTGGTGGSLPANNALLHTVRVDWRDRTKDWMLLTDAEVATLGVLRILSPTGGTAQSATRLTLVFPASMEFGHSYLINNLSGKDVIVYPNHRNERTVNDTTPFNAAGYVGAVVPNGTNLAVKRTANRIVRIGIDAGGVAASQAEMEAGTEADLRVMSPLRVRQAILAYPQRYAALADLPAPASLPVGMQAEVIATAAPYETMLFAVTGHASGSRQWKCIGGSSGDLLNRNVGSPQGGTGGSPISVSTARQWVRVPISGSAAPYATWDFRFPFFQVSLGGRNNTGAPWNLDSTWYTIDAEAVRGLTAASAGQAQATGTFIEMGRLLGVTNTNAPIYRVVAFGRTSSNEILVNLHSTTLQAFPLRIRGHA